MLWTLTASAIGMPPRDLPSANAVKRRVFASNAELVGTYLLTVATLFQLVVRRSGIPPLDPKTAPGAADPDGTPVSRLAPPADPQSPPTPLAPQKLRADSKSPVEASRAPHYDQPYGSS